MSENDKFNLETDRFCLILAKNNPINQRNSIDHFFADQFRLP